MKIEIHIERVVLDGVPTEQPGLLRRALERELTQKLKQGGLSPELQRGTAIPHLNAGGIEIAKRQPVAKLGSQIAGAVYRGIGVKR